MTAAANQSQVRLRRTVYVLLITVGTGVMLGRIFAVDKVDEAAVQEYRIRKALSRKREALSKVWVNKQAKQLRQQGLEGEALQREVEKRLEEELNREEARLRSLIRMQRPFLSANDRSRWCTVRALVEAKMRVEGAPYSIDKVVREPTWDTIDMVKHDGHLYSSKPPLLPTLLAAEYWLIHRLTGATLGTHPYAIGRFMLVTVNVVPLLLCFLLLAELVERLGTTDWGRMFVMGAAVFGTFLTTFAVVINNHLPAAVSTAIALRPASCPPWPFLQR